MPKYNGHKNWNHWNVSLWINNDEELYGYAKSFVRDCKGDGGKDRAARLMLDLLHMYEMTHTPDGAPYSVTTIRAAMRHW